MIRTRRTIAATRREKLNDLDDMGVGGYFDLDAEARVERGAVDSRSEWETEIEQGIL